MAHGNNRTAGATHTSHTELQVSGVQMPAQAKRLSSSSHVERAAALLEESEVHSSTDFQRQSDEHGSSSALETQEFEISTTSPPIVDHQRSDIHASAHFATTSASKVIEEIRNGSTPSPLGSQTSTDRSIRRRQPARAYIRPPSLGRISQSHIRLHRPSSPLTVHDLGADYTRYYVPFARSVSSSPVGKGSPRQSTSPSISLSTPPSPTKPASTRTSSLTNPVENADTEKIIFLIDDRLSAPYEEKEGTWPLWGDEEEEDDAMHLPQPDDDVRFSIKWKDRFSRENFVQTFGVIMMFVGLLIIFVGLPVLSFLGVLNYTSGYETPLDEMPQYRPRKHDWATVNERDYRLLQNIRTGLIDPDTPEHAMRKRGEYGDEYELVFSDEFNDPNRTFYEGDDPYFYAPDLWYGATQDLEWYDPDAVTTWDGVLELRLDKFRNHGLDFRSGMLNSWNHLCFKGGIFEVSMSLPGPAGVHGLWPGVWTLGNLGRPGYMASTDGTWPYTYQACDAGITPNQSSSDGISSLPGQKLPSCTCPGEDHPSPGTGRGAPEIDIAEVSVSYDEMKIPVATQTFQVAPFDIWYYPNYDFVEFPDQRFSYTNTYTGGPFQQAVSGTTTLNRDWYDGKTYQRFSFEYVPGEGEGSFVTWKVGGQTMFTIDGRAIGPNGNIQARQISQEPMALVLNLGISNAWTWIDWERLVFPAVMRVDYVRWYQKKGETMVTCDPPGFETTKYIKEHLKAYTNPEFTSWNQTGYPWPMHKLNSEC